MFYYLKEIEPNKYIQVKAEGSPMPDGYLNGRPVYFGDTYLDGVDSFFESASWADTDQDLTDNELDELTEKYADYLQEQSAEHYGYWKD